jgi:uncharacterized protein YheU (UPF0270 family)
MTDHAVGVEVRQSRLSPEALRGLLESFLLRERTAYGQRQYSLAEKVQQLMRQLECAQPRVIFEPRMQSVEIVRSERQCAARN